jgi:hypothetical protein
MALANVACLLARRGEGNRVLMVDWDLEAPGLHRYFRRLVNARFTGADEEAFNQAPGLMDWFSELDRAVHERPDGAVRSILDSVPIEPYIVETDIPSLYLLKAGRFDYRYSTTVNTFGWEGLHDRSPWLLREAAAYLAERFHYVLIDSRTGITDTGGICTSIMPDVLVVVFTPNRQSLLGAIEVAGNAGRYRRDSDDVRPLRIFPLPARIDAAEPLLRDLWRFGNPEDGHPGYQPAFEALFQQVYSLPECDLDAYFSEVQLQHVPRYAYGEEIAVRSESGDRLSLTRSYELFLERIAGAGPAWEQPERSLAASAVLPVRDQAWIQSHRAVAEPALRAIGGCGSMEASFFLTPSIAGITQQRLFKAAQAAQVPGAGWPIGAVVASSKESRPRPNGGGLAAEIVDRATKSYDRWELRDDGSFYFFRNLEEEREYLLADDRIDRIVELLLYCRRLYSFLGAGQSVRVLISVSYSGLDGRALGRRMPDAPDQLTRLTGVSNGDAVQAELIADLGSIQTEIVRYVRLLTGPVFALFNFYEMPEAEYNHLVTKRMADWGYAAV